MSTVVFQSQQILCLSYLGLLIDIFCHENEIQGCKTVLEMAERRKYGSEISEGETLT